MHKPDALALAVLLMFAFLAVLVVAAFVGRHPKEDPDVTVARWHAVVLAGLSAQLWLVVLIFLELRP